MHKELADVSIAKTALVIKLCHILFLKFGNQTIFVYNYQDRKSEIVLTNLIFDYFLVKNIFVLCLSQTKPKNGMC